ncbi:hypothetical protein pb186bvf_005031 [Paramecium bursaria]
MTNVGTNFGNHKQLSKDPLKNEPNFQTSQDVEEYLQILLQHQGACERAAKYMEAEAAKLRISDLKIQLLQQRKKEMVQSHSQQKSEHERAHMEEFNQFNTFWDQKILKFNEEARSVEQDLLLKQQQDIKTTVDELEATLPYKPKESSELLNLRKIEEHLAKQKNYVEAHQIQIKRSKLEQDEVSNYQSARSAKIKNQVQQMQMRHQNELSALQQRIRAGQDELRKNRSIDLERLLQKYQNLKNELEQQQQMDLLAFDGQFKSKGQPNQSFYRSMQSKVNK